MTTKTQDTAPHFKGLDLDTLEPKDDIAAPFVFTAGGRTWTAHDPKLLGWHQFEVLNRGDDEEMLTALLGEEQAAEFGTLEVPKWKFDRLAEAMIAHFNPTPAE